jgi:hypothetical protein
MSRYIFLLIFLSLKVHPLSFIDSMELATPDLYPFYNVKYYQWQKKQLPCNCEENNDLEQLIIEKIKSFSTWTMLRTKEIKRQNFQYLYRLQDKKITKTIIISISNSDLQNSHLINFFKSINVFPVQKEKDFKTLSYNYWSKELTLTYQHKKSKKYLFTSYKYGEEPQSGILTFPSIKKSFSNKFTPYLGHFIHQEKFNEDKDQFYTRTYLKVLNILSLPKKLQLLTLRHKREWNLDSVTVYTSNKDEIGIYYP